MPIALGIRISYRIRIWIINLNPDPILQKVCIRKPKKVINMGSFKIFKVHKRLPVPTLTISFCKFLKKIYFITKFCDLLGIRVRVSIVLEVEPDPKYLKFVSAILQNNLSKLGTLYTRITIMYGMLSFFLLATNSVAKHLANCVAKHK